MRANRRKYTIGKEVVLLNEPFGIWFVIALIFGAILEIFGLGGSFGILF